MWGHIQGLIEQVIDQPNQPVKKLTILTQKEAQEILYEWNHTQTHYPDQSTFDQLFTAQSKRTPNGVAIIDHTNREITYSQLNQASDHIANLLSKIRC
jgi:Non-ribosomal peptide synthetase modules and related proteins